MTRPPAMLLLAVLLAVPAPARADLATDAYRGVGLAVGDVLTGTVLSANVMPGPAKQVIMVVTHFTGKKTREDAVNVQLVVFERDGKALRPVYRRDFRSETGLPVARGELQLIDLDQDELQEIIVSYDVERSPLIRERRAEVILLDNGAFRSGWSGPVSYDATKAARDLPLERRDRFEREIDFRETLRTRGITLFFKKTMIAVAGERLAEPKVIQETFPLRGASNR